MALCIRNPHAEKLLRQLSRQTGQGLTQTILAVLEREAHRTQGHTQASRIEDGILAISQRCAALPDRDPRQPDEILGYDEHGGLPGW